MLAVVAAGPRMDPRQAKRFQASCPDLLDTIDEVSFDIPGMSYRMVYESGLTLQVHFETLLRVI